MNTNRSHKRQRRHGPTLGELVETITQLTHNERLSSYIVADLINSRRVRLEGRYHGRRVLIAG